VAGKLHRFPTIDYAVSLSMDENSSRFQVQDKHNAFYLSEMLRQAAACHYKTT